MALINYLHTRFSDKFVNISLREIYHTSAWALWGIIIVLLGLASLTRVVSTFKFRKLLSTATEKSSGTIPLAPFWLPGIFHAIPLLLYPASFTRKLVNKNGWREPLRAKAGRTDFILVANPEYIQTIFKNSRFLSAKSVTMRAARYIVGVPEKFMPFYEADDSGMGAEPRKSSQTLQENRILYQQTYTAQKYLASPYLELLSERFLQMLHDSVERLNIGSEWVEYPDLYEFLQITVSKANIEAIMGSKILELNPNLINHFWEAKNSAPEFFQGWPRWVIPRAFRARDRVIESIQKWHNYAFAHSSNAGTGVGDPDWEPIFGTRYVKARLQFITGMKPLNARVWACEDWGLMFGSNANTVPCVFWYLYEALRDSSLKARMSEEVASCGSQGRPISIPQLAQQPLLQSVYAEVLRLRVSILVSRVAEFGDVKFSNYTIRQNNYLLVPTDALHFNEEAWGLAGRPQKRPLKDFDGERFLVPSETGYDFSMDGLAGLWIPYGGGNRMCPGRHLAKLEMMITYAYLFSNYDLESPGIDACNVQSDMRFAPFGALPPDRKLPFRIRRKVSKD